MGLCAVIYSTDERVLRILRSLLADLSIEAEFAPGSAAAIDCLRRQKYDGIFAECDDPDGIAVLRAIRRSRHNQRSVAFVIGSDLTAGPLAAELGVHFVLQKPLVTEKVKRTLKAAHGLMMREKRAHFRHEVAAPASLRTEKSGLTATLRNLCPGGAMLETSGVLKKGQPIQIRFMLPESTVIVETPARVVWCDPTGRTGLQFEFAAEEPRRALVEWAAARSVEPEQQQAEAPAEVAAAAPETIPLQATGAASQAAAAVAPARAPRIAIKVLGFEAGRPAIVLGSCTKLTASGLSAELQDDLNLEPSVLLQLTIPGRSHPTLLHAEICVKDGLEYSFEFVALTTFVQGLLQQTATD
jgi:CheY-like chemotaxis protein